MGRMVNSIREVNIELRRLEGIINRNAETSTTSTDADSNVLQYDVITLTSAEIKALNTTPKQLTEAPSFGRWVQLESITLVMLYGGNNVFIESNSNLVVRYNSSGVYATNAIEVTNFINVSYDSVAFIRGREIATVALADIVETSLELFNPNTAISGNSTGDNQLKVIITYWIRDKGV